MTTEKNEEQHTLPNNRKFLLLISGLITSHTCLTFYDHGAGTYSFMDPKGFVQE